MQFHKFPSIYLPGSYENLLKSSCSLAGPIVQFGLFVQIWTIYFETINVIPHPGHDLSSGVEDGARQQNHSQV
jgi:hypothetical protein